MQAKWDDLDEKPAAVAITISVFVAIWAASGVVDAVDRLPIIGGLLEFVGLLVTGWFAYRYLIFGPDRCVFLATAQSVDYAFLLFFFGQQAVAAGYVC